MIDTHCHLDHKQFDADRSEVLDRAFHAGVRSIIIPAIEPSRFNTLHNFVQSDSRLFAGMGIHPHHALECNDNEIKNIEHFATDEKVCAIGEIGLDYHYNFAPHDIQQKVFREQIQIAKRKNLPVIIHNRESDDDLFRILREEQDGTLRGVLHCFTGTPIQAEEAIKLGFHISVTGNITFKNSQLDETIRVVPLDRIMLETDAPYMTPVPFRGKRNEPSMVRFVAEKLATFYSLSFQEICDMTTTTAQKFFAIPVLCLLVFFCLPFVTLAQNEEESEPAEELSNPFPKKIGVAPVLGSLTPSESFSSGGQFTRSKGFLGFGAAAQYFFTDHISVGFSHLWYKNPENLEIDPATKKPFRPFPDYHKSLDVYFQYTLNPWNVLSFYLNAGPAFLSNAYYVQNNNPEYTTYTGIMGTFGLGANIKTPAGLFYPSAEIRFSIAPGLNEKIKTQDSTGNMTERIRTSFNFSVIRFTVWWFPSI